MKLEYFIENFNIAGIEYDPKTSLGIFWIASEAITLKDLSPEDVLKQVENILKEFFPTTFYVALDYDNDSDRLEIASRMKITKKLKDIRYGKGK
jgi:hypothetical protein